jgi:hypothetical protein
MINGQEEEQQLEVLEEATANQYSVKSKKNESSKNKEAK